MKTKKIIDMKNSLRFTILIIIILLLTLVVIRSDANLANLYKTKKTTSMLLPLPLLELTMLKNGPAISEFYLISAIMHFVSENRNTKLIAQELYEGYKADPYIMETAFFLGNVLPIKKEDAKIANRYLKLSMTHRADWHIPVYIGYNLLFNLKEYEKAARYFYIATQFPGVKPYVHSMLIMAYYRENNIKNALLYLTSLYKETENPARKKILLKKIEWLQNIIDLNKEVELFYKKEGRYPENLEELVKKGYIESIPKDPFGRGYYFDKKEHKIKSKW